MVEGTSHKSKDETEEWKRFIDGRVDTEEEEE